MTDDELKKLVAGLAVAQDRTDAQLAKTDAQLSRTDAKLDRLAEMYGGVGNNQGKVAEEFYFNSLKQNPVLSGIHFDLIEKNVTRHVANIEEEYDLLRNGGVRLRFLWLLWPLALLCLQVVAGDFKFGGCLCEESICGNERQIFFLTNGEMECIQCT